MTFPVCTKCNAALEEVVDDQGRTRLVAVLPHPGYGPNECPNANRGPHKAPSARESA